MTATAPGLARGTHALVLQRTYPPNTSTRGRESIVAVNLADGSPRVVAEWPTPPYDQARLAQAENALTPQLSPDRRYVVLAVTLGTSGPQAGISLVVLDLFTGQVTSVAAAAEQKPPLQPSAVPAIVAYHAVMPAWSPRGDLIAFVFVEARADGTHRDLGIWVATPDGGNARQVLPGLQFPEATGVLGWNGDGTAITLTRGFEQSAYFVLELATGKVTTLAGGTALGRSQADWRRATPALAAAFVETPYGGGTRRIVVGDDQLGSRTRVIRELSPLVNAYFLRARWRPGSDEILYQASGADADGRNMGVQIAVIPASGGPPRVVADKPAPMLFAEWMPDGSAIVYLQALDDAGSAELRVIRPDASGDRRVYSFGKTAERSRPRRRLLLKGGFSSRQGPLPHWRVACAGVSHLDGCCAAP
jgi:Tol biopolymer transport system component